MDEGFRKKWRIGGLKANRMISLKTSHLTRWTAVFLVGLLEDFSKQLWKLLPMGIVSRELRLKKLHSLGDFSPTGSLRHGGSWEVLANPGWTPYTVGLIQIGSPKFRFLSQRDLIFSLAMFPALNHDLHGLRKQISHRPTISLADLWSWMT